MTVNFPFITNLNQLIISIIYMYTVTAMICHCPDATLVKPYSKHTAHWSTIWFNSCWPFYVANTAHLIIFWNFSCGYFFFGLLTNLWCLFRFIVILIGGNLNEILHQGLVDLATRWVWSRDMGLVLLIILLFLLVYLELCYFLLMKEFPCTLYCCYSAYQSTLWSYASLL